MSRRIYLRIVFVILWEGSKARLSMAKGIRHLKALTRCGTGGAGALRFLPALFSLALILNSLGGFLHAHHHDDEMHIGGSEHGVECTLCELGHSFHNDLAAVSEQAVEVQVAVSWISHTVASFDIVAITSSTSPRAPPALL